MSFSVSVCVSAGAGVTVMVVVSGGPEVIAFGHEFHCLA